jgi:hypothetical protein
MLLMYQRVAVMDGQEVDKPPLFADVLLALQRIAVLNAS